ncbi:MAG: glycerophosphodiester phosphodiesterase, partial [Hydrogenophaga sp.]|nr:glycerophosphodiester phosphodiesterase [Hydrogenophaga sp.]
EIKPTTGLARETGRVVAQEAARLWAQRPGAVPPLLTSFEPEALQGARETQPGLPRGLLLETLWPGWLTTAIKLGCQAVICDQDLWEAGNVAQVHQAGLRTLAYTVNEATSVQRLLALGIDGLITDRVDVFPPA